MIVHPSFVFMSFSNYLESLFAREMFGKTDWSPPGTIYVSLHFDAPGDTGANEINNGGYARVSTSPSDWTEVSNGVIENNTLVEFPAATADYEDNSGNTEKVSHFGLWDASSGGNFLGGDELQTDRSITQGATPEFESNTLQWTVD